MRPLVSVIIPTYNNERQLPRCIDSLLAQTYGNFELIAVDDGSTDGSGSVLDAYAERDARIRVIHRKNGGVSSARNVGIDDAKGEYVTFVDGDDAVDPSYIEYLAGALRQDGTAISSCIISRETENEVVTFSEVRKTGEHITTRVFGLADCAERVRYGSFNSCGVMFRADAIGDTRFDCNAHFAEDSLFFFEVFSRVGKFSFVGLPLYFYITNPDSAMNKPFGEKRLAEITTWERIHTLVAPLGEPLESAVRQKIATVCMHLFYGLYRSGNLTDETARMLKSKAKEGGATLFLTDHRLDRKAKLKMRVFLLPSPIRRICMAVM